MKMSTLPFSRRGSALIGQEMFKVLERARVMEAQGQEVFHLELGNPRLPPPPVALSETIRSIQRLEVGYTYSAGHPALRQAVAELYSGLHRRPITEENVVISPANLIINQFLDLVCDPGDRVVFFTPAFPTYWAAATHIGLKVEEVPLHLETGYDLTDEAVSRALASRPKAIIVNSANNPTGAVYKAEQLERLARACNAKGIWLLSDETYGHIDFGQSFHSLLGLDLPFLVVMSSFSKIFSIPGYRIGFVIGQPAVMHKFSLSVSTLISCLPIFTQLGCALALKSIVEYTADVRRKCAAISKWCTDTLRSCERIKFNPPQAGFYLFLDISDAGLDDMTFCQRLLEEEYTAVTPGRSFGPAYDRSIRIATCGNEKSVKNGVKRLISFMNKF